MLDLISYFVGHSCWRCPTCCLAGGPPPLQELIGRTKGLGLPQLLQDRLGLGRFRFGSFFVFFGWFVCVFFNVFAKRLDLRCVFIILIIFFFLLLFFFGLLLECFVFSFFSLGALQRFLYSFFTIKGLNEWNGNPCCMLLFHKIDAKILPTFGSSKHEHLHIIFY